MTKTAIIAGQGGLPAHLVAALRKARQDYVVAEMEGFPSGLADENPILFRVERLVPFLDGLAKKGVTRVVFAGAIQRRRLEPELFDPQTATLVPRLVGAIRSGDDAALREVIAIFEEWGFSVEGVQSVAADLVPGAGLLTGTPGEADRADAERAAVIVAGLGGLDLGQGAIVAQGLCIAVETLPGTNAMLDFAALHADRLRPDPNGAGGVFFKAPKPGQDRRVDLPTLGPETVRRAATAGLAGIAWEAGGVICLDRTGMIAEAKTSGLFLWAREP